jgi:hypothetical protein
MAENSNTAAARGWGAIGQDTVLPQVSSPFRLPGWNSYQHRSEIDGDPNYIGYYDGQGDSGTIRFANGSFIRETYTDRDGSSLETIGAGTGYISRFSDSSGELVSASGHNTSGAIWSEDGQNGTFTYNGQTFSGPTFASSAGLTLGSTIGGILGGNSLVGRIAGATVLGTLGESVGNILSRSGLGTALLGNGSLDPSLFDSAVTTTVADFGGDLSVNAIGDIAGSFSSLLFGEAAHALGLNGFAAGAFTTIGTSITSQLATNLGAMTLNAAGVSTTLTANFSPEAFIGNAESAIGGYFGSYLAAQILPPTGIASSIGGRIGGAVGNLLGLAVPVIGNFIGSFVGGLVGSAIGSIFDPGGLPWDAQIVGGSNGQLGLVYWNANAQGNAYEFTNLSYMVSTQANQVLALTRSNPYFPDINGLSGNGGLLFERNNNDVRVIYPDGNAYYFYNEGTPQPIAVQELFNAAESSTYELVRFARIASGDPITTGALAAARVQDTTTPSIYADLMVAQDYERYRANAEIVNTAMAANPDSDFTAGWNVTLMRARGLGLDRIVSHAGWTADLTDNHETIRNDAGMITQDLTFNADGTVTTINHGESFAFNFLDSTLSYDVNGHVYLIGPDGTPHDLSGDTYVAFTDGTIDLADGNSLVDDLWYDSQYHDVYLAGADPDAHYAANGWHEGRNPNRLFDTNYYLAANSDVAAAGINPLAHYDANGWHEGRNPSAAFSTTDYEIANPDVAASGADPLQQYLAAGAQQNRIVFPANAGLAGPVGDFDPAFYLANYSDVAAAGVNPLQHYMVNGWHEGRNPNAYFDTNYYLAGNGDVAAAGIDPMLHYAQFGWREGRNPSAAFDTNLYLQHNPDVAEARIDPLAQFLASGQQSGLYHPYAVGSG